MSERMTLVPGQWYAWTMFPGYGPSPYHSPIRVQHVTPVAGRSRLYDLEFFNMGYAAGVQNMQYRLKTLRREAGYILAADYESERSVAIVNLEPLFLLSHAPQVMDRIERLMAQTGSFFDAMDIFNGFAPVTE
ncbi:hypothetical protein [Sphingomonas prati]|uniref:Uncharacterized protein n=1 Tax=Sphingomonas prati TaxID=1843237 RepID=A0A7W9F315_9SPHN|nr:hypothetical protein [Sphingomonas prati]MBB5730936.1 hypothetical protein [Sphingomonas prati]GGE97875.1 hypothetical protein GCM10011404_33760 [Sphingomonas prati]